MTMHITTGAAASAVRCLFATLLLIAASVVTPGAVTDARAADEKCFGASGQGCGGWTNGSGMPSMAFCAHTNGLGTNQGICLVSGGSMTHDPCCANNPRGKQCGGSPSNNQCSAEWDKSVSRAIWGYQWRRVVDISRVNNTGVVERALYCAKSDRGVHRNDANYCCSNSSRPGNFWERLGRPSLNICR